MARILLFSHTAFSTQCLLEVSGRYSHKLLFSKTFPLALFLKSHNSWPFHYFLFVSNSRKYLRMVNNCFTHHSFLRLVLPQTTALVTEKRFCKSRFCRNSKWFAVIPQMVVNPAYFKCKFFSPLVQWHLKQSWGYQEEHSLLWVAASISNSASCSGWTPLTVTTNWHSQSLHCSRSSLLPAAPLTYLI